VEDHFEKLGAEERLTVDVEFKRDKIRLDIPINGVTAGEWTLKPLVFPLEVANACFYIYIYIYYIKY